MKKVALATILGTILTAWVMTAAEPRDRFWPQWRGPQADGVAPLADPPIEWSEAKNIRWKIDIPGKGSSSPIVWQDRVFVLTAVPAEDPSAAATPAAVPGRGRGGPPLVPYRFIVLALNRKDGSIAWQKVTREETPHEGHQPNNTFASASALTDGQRVFAYFGSRGLYAYDFNGNLLWQQDFGDMASARGFGEGSSPALHGDRLIVNWDHEGGSFIVALDAKTGKEIWKRERDEGTSWSTPLIVEHKGVTQVVTAATKKVRTYDLKTGELIWEAEGLTPNTIPSPVARDGFVYLTSGFRGSKLLAIDLDKAKGQITDAIVWRHDRDTPYVPSPLLYDDSLYFLKSNNGILTNFNVKTGKPHYELQRLEGVPNVYASPVGASGRVYIAGREGATLVIKHGPTFEVLATNKLDDGFDASPAVVDKEIYLRGYRRLYCIATK